MTASDPRLPTHRLASWIRARRIVSVAIVAAIVSGIVGTAVWVDRRGELMKERWREWVAVSGAWSGVGTMVRARLGVQYNPLTSADVDEFVKALREERRDRALTHYLWFVNPSPSAWTTSFSQPFDYTCLLAVVDPASGEVVYLLAAHINVSLDGKSMAVEYSAKRDPAISPNGARRLTEGWVQVD